MACSGVSPTPLDFGTASHARRKRLAGMWPSRKKGKGRLSHRQTPGLGSFGRGPAPQAPREENGQQDCQCYEAPLGEPRYRGSPD